MIDDEGLVHTTDEDEYTDGEFVTDGEEYEDGEGTEDGDVEDGEEDDEEYEDEDAQEIQGIPPAYQGQAPGASRSREEVKDWQGLSTLPDTTQQVLLQAISTLKNKGRQEITILLLGKNGVGKSSTGNSLLGEQAFTATPFVQDINKPVIAVRSKAGFNVRVIDTPSLVEGDDVSSHALDTIAEVVSQQAVDVVLYLDRLDLYRVEPVDEQAISAVSSVLGADIWRHTLLGLTRAQLTSPPPNTTYESFLAKRVENLQRVIRAQLPGSGPRPVALIENSSKCRTDAGSKEKVLPNGTAWLPALFQQITEQAAAASRSGFKADMKAAAKKANPDRRRRWLIPVLLAAQIAFKVFVLDRLIEEDGYKGDEYGPYNPEYVAEERARSQREKEEKKRADKERQERARVAQSTASAASDDSSDEEDEEEDEEESGSASD